MHDALEERKWFSQYSLGTAKAATAIASFTNVTNTTFETAINDSWNDQTKGYPANARKGPQPHEIHDNPLANIMILVITSAGLGMNTTAHHRSNRCALLTTTVFALLPSTMKNWPRRSW